MTTLRATSGLAFVRARAAAVDEAVRAFFKAVPGESTPDIAVVAVGGYGRRELFPGSDVDLLVLHEEGAHRLAERVAEAVLYPLWDLGMATGNAVRTVAECEAAGAADPRALTTLLDARLVAGSEDLFASLNVAVDGAIRDNEARFVGLLRTLRERRRERFGFLSHATEPDLKEPLGGLRDVPLLAWLARAGLPAPPEGRIADAAETLRRVRVALHLHTGTRSNRLEPADHEAVARALGLSDDGNWEARDALMRDVLRAGRAVDVVVTEALTAAVAAPRAPEVTPPADLAAALESAAPGGRLAALVQVLSAGEDGARAVEIADARGVMESYLSEWPLLRGRVQRDPYHRFPVDVHLVRTAAEVASILSHPADAFVADEVETIGDPGPLLVAAFLHDAGKVGRGSHVAVGEDVARRALEALGALPGVRDDVVFLVREHLLLADTATRRDIGEEDVVLGVAGAIGDRRRLAMLHVLTLADATATGSAAASSWRMGLVRDLVGRVEKALARGLIREEDVDQLARAERAVRVALEGTPVAARAGAFLRAVPSAYLRWVDPADAAGDLDLVLPRPSGREVRMTVRPGRAAAAGLSRLAVAARDRPGLLSDIAGACTVAGLSVVSAQIFTTSDGVALDVFGVRGTYEEDVPPGRWDRLRETLHAALAGEADIAAAVAVLRRHARSPAAEVPLTVRVDDDASDFHTVIEVGAADRPALLFDLASAVAAQAVDVHLARVATYGHRVVDVFYVTDLWGRKLSPELAARVREGIERALSANSEPHGP